MRKHKVKVGIIGGSGLGNPNILEGRNERVFDTPFGKPSDVLIEGKISGVDCVLLARHGREHTIMPSNVNYRANIWALKHVGCTHVIVSTATGSLKEHIKPGELVILDSFIDRTKQRSQTFYDGSQLAPVGICHLPMEPAFCSATRQILIDCAKELNITHHPTGTCVVIEGPRFSSIAESKMFQMWGGDVVNMTTVPEVVLAKEAGLCYAAVALVTDFDCWRNTGEKVSVETVLKAFCENIDKITQLFLKSVPEIAKQDWDSYIDSLQETVSKSVMLPQSK